MVGSPSRVFLLAYNDVVAFYKCNNSGYCTCYNYVMVRWHFRTWLNVELIWESQHFIYLTKYIRRKQWNVVTLCYSHHNLRMGALGGTDIIKAIYGNGSLVQAKLVTCNKVEVPYLYPVYCLQNKMVISKINFHFAHCLCVCRCSMQIVLVDHSTMITTPYLFYILCVQV